MPEISRKKENDKRLKRRSKEAPDPREWSVLTFKSKSISRSFGSTKEHNDTPNLRLPQRGNDQLIDARKIEIESVICYMKSLNTDSESEFREKRDQERNFTTLEESDQQKMQPRNRWRMECRRRECRRFVV